MTAQHTMHAQDMLVCENVEKYFGTKSNITKALAGMSFSMKRGEFVGIMGLLVPAKVPCSTAYRRSISLRLAPLWSITKMLRACADAIWLIFAARSLALFFRILICSKRLPLLKT